MFHLRPVAGLRVAAAVFVLFLAMLLAPGPVRAQVQDAYTVRNVPVDVTAVNAGLARNQALAEGQRRAFQMLVERLAGPDGAARLPKLGDAQLVDLVLDVGIDQEKRSAVRYIASLSVRFKPDAVRRLLRANNIAYAEWRGRPVVVLPVWVKDAAPVLAETPNPWRDAWRSGAAQGVVPLIAPSPEQIDGTVTAQQAAAGGDDAISAVMARFSTRDVLIAKAATQAGDGGKLHLDVTVTGTGLVAPLVAGPHSYDGAAGETEDMLLRRAVEDLARRVNEGYKSGNTLQYDRTGTLAVVAPLNGSLDDWVALREKLLRTTPVRGYEVAALSRTRAELVLHYVGDQPQLESVLMQNGLVLSWADDHWELANTQARPATGQP